MNRNSSSRTGFKVWLLIWGLGLAGQMCWNIENQWFNTFVYAKIAKDPAIITWMLSISAIATTFSTFFFGNWADRTGKRRLFISWGYIFWGVFTIVFGLTEFLDRKSYLFTAFSVVMADMIMSFFGSMAYDAGFNTWINDILNNKNRGQIGGALATQPVLATMLATLVGGMLIGNDENYMRLFVVMGGFSIGFGMISMFTLGRKDDVPASVRGTFWQQFMSVFNFSRFIKLKELLLVNLGVAIYFTGFNIFFAYVGNYIIYYLGYKVTDLAIIEAVPLLLAMFTAIPVSRFINRDKHPYIVFFSIACCVVGLLLMWPLQPESVNTAILFNPNLWAGIFLNGVGYVGLLQTVKVWTKQLYPVDSKGQFEGIWILFFVLFPMVTGSILGGAVVKNSGVQFLNEVSGKMEFIPNGNIFIVAAISILLSFIPFLFTLRWHRRRTTLTA